MRDFEQYHDNYASLPFEPVQEHYRRRRLLEVLQSAGASQVLEVGCGRDSIFRHWQPYATATIIEPIAEHLRACEVSLGGTKGLTLTTFLGTLDEYCNSDVAPIRFDAAILSSVLHEFPDPETALSQVRSILMQDGILILVTTNPRSIHRILGVDLGILKSPSDSTETEALMKQRSAWSVQELSILLEGTGFMIEQQFTSFPKLMSHAQMQAALDTGAIDRPFLDQMYDLSGALSSHGSEIFTIAKRK